MNFRWPLALKILMSKHQNCSIQRIAFQVYWWRYDHANNYVIFRCLSGWQELQKCCYVLRRWNLKLMTPLYGGSYLIGCYYRPISIQLKVRISLYWYIYFILALYWSNESHSLDQGWNHRALIGLISWPLQDFYEWSIWVVNMSDSNKMSDSAVIYNLITTN